MKAYEMICLTNVFQGTGVCNTFLWDAGTNSESFSSPLGWSLY